MKRTLYDSLKEWKMSPSRKPLVLEGARQVGKTWLLQEFGRNEYRQMVYVNCHNNPFAQALFQKDFEIDSKQLTKIDQFASDSNMHVMIINTQAFAARGEDARRIYMKLDAFRSRKPIDVIASTNPILIIDEPQSVLGADKKNATREKLKEFKPLFTLLYSATHRAADIVNMIYRLDAMDAYNKKLVKKISVKGIEQKGTTATNGYVYLESIELSQGNPVARLGFDKKMASGVKPTVQKVSDGFDIYQQSGQLEEYAHGYRVESIDDFNRTVRLLNGLVLSEGEMVGRVNDIYVRRHQIRETILSHIEKERKLFKMGIKCLSLFFIDHVDNYRIYETGGGTRNGKTRACCTAACSRSTS